MDVDTVTRVAQSVVFLSTLFEEAHVTHQWNLSVLLCGPCFAKHAASVHLCSTSQKY